MWDEIRADMAAPYPMHRLLQGDVGSGKTIVAALAVCTAVEAGYQAAVMAPTEILAEQHYATLSRLLEPLGVHVTLLTSGLKARTRPPGARRGAGLRCVIGTHALVEERVSFQRSSRLDRSGDEPHRVRLSTSARGSSQGERPTSLVMTATPFPESLALTLYGAPTSACWTSCRGSQAVRTEARTDSRRAQIYTFPRDQCRGPADLTRVSAGGAECRADRPEAATDMAARR